ncbi:hypothetical protein [Oceanobacillus damuensis]|uniref:hypothetical protein n=1 Tax=Oceanobacillus damuensis TaxID=937928 RepID=UPI000A7FC0EC|nr:hypothetical protein [Oceanobacillus damuensis]
MANILNEIRSGKVTENKMHQLVKYLTPSLHGAVLSQKSQIKDAVGSSSDFP